MTNPRKPERKTEFLLLLAVQVVLLFGLALVFQGKKATTGYPARPVNVNALSPARLAAALSIGGDQARQLASAQTRAWPSVYALRHARALKGVVTQDIGDEFVVRTPRDVSRLFWGGTLAFLLVFWLAHAVLRKSAPAADPFLLPLAALLSGLGLMLVYSVKDPYRDTFAFTGQAWGVCLWGMLALLVPLTRPFARLPLRRYGYAYAGAAAMLMLGLLVLGHGPGGVHIQLFGVEPVEFIKLLLVLFVASYLAERRGTLGDAKAALPRLRDFGPLAGVYGFCLALFLLVKDLGPAVLLFGVFLALLFLTTRRWVYPLVGSALLLLAAGAGYALHFGFFATRVTMWLHPWDNSDRNGAQLAQGLWGMATGGMGGSGLGLGRPDFVPRAGSDSIFATLGEQTGLVGGLVVLAVYALIIARGLRVARRAGTEFDRLLASGLTLLLGFQAMIILGGVSGLVPLTGVTLPFVSYGTSSLVSCFFALGLLLHLSGKTLPAGAVDRATPEWTRAARGLALACAAYLLVGVGLIRLFDVQGIQDVALATRLLRTPDRDTARGATPPPHINPRLLAYAAHIPRGAVLDRNGEPLARDPLADDEPGQTTLLCPDGRARVYSGGAAFAQIVAAVERPAAPANALGANDRLRGFPGYADLLAPYRTRFLPFHRDPRGQDVTLTLDRRLQAAALDALRHYAAAVKDKRTGRPKDKGAAVLLDVRTGEVLAAVSLPTFDPATLTPDAWAALQTQPAGPAFDRALSGLYPPGSAFKIVTASAALAHGLGGTVIQCAHTDPHVTWRFDGRRYARRITDEEGFVPHGSTDLAKALRVSCNVYFAHLGIAVGAIDFNAEARHGFGLTHMRPLAEMGASLADSGYGQGAAQVTPLEMGRVAQAVADDGHALPARFIKGSGPAGAGTPALTPQSAARLRGMLARVVTDGTARGVFDGLGVSVAGKTGSAQNNQGDGETHSWFAGFAPADRPTVAFACVVENGGAGRAAAAPVCREMVRAALAR
jgi:cell division protein FtsW (lipid II flippase)